MTRRVPRRLLSGMLIAPALIVALTSCAMHEGTQGWYDPTDGTSVDAGPIDIRNVLVVASPEGEATVIASMVNNGSDDALAEITIGDATIAPAAIDLPADTVTTIGPEGDGRLDAADADAAAGHTIDIEFTFENAPQASVTAVAVENDGIYADAFSATQ